MSPGVCRLSLCALLSFAGASAAANSEEDALPFWRPAVVCFPPMAPVFGAEISNRVPVGEDAVRLRPPPELADYVGEYFYPALSTRIIGETLPNYVKARLEAYLARRGELVNQLADQLVALHEADDATRAVRLRAFADEQDPKILALEREAEELRKIVVTGGPLLRSVDWSRSRNWFVGVTRFPSDLHAREAEYQVVRAAAYYQDGLLTEQRGMLLEVAAELRNRALAARAIPGPRQGDAHAMFFSPAMSRLRLPAKMSAELTAKIARFNRIKTELKQELVNAVLHSDRVFASERTPVFERLADAQWPRLTELEKLADEIREELGRVPPVKLSAPPYIPPMLLRRIDEYLIGRSTYIAEFNQTMRAASELIPRPRLDGSLPPEERNRRIRAYETARAAARERVAARFHEETKERFEDLRRSYDRIAAELKVVAEGQFDPETGRPLDAEGLLRTYTVVMERFATFGREEVIYRGYRTAMLMPGLSLEQRRLLFGAAVMGLAQPLPFGESLPTGPMPVPRS